jgi:hypothetical protein
MGEVVYRSHVSVTRHQGPLRTATVPAEGQPVTFGVHATIERVLGFHADRCPVARTIGSCVAISTSLELDAGGETS